jgi:hypothetical protein
MLIALTSGLNEFPKFMTNAKVFFFGGFLLFVFHLLISGLMFMKYPIKGEMPKLQTEP